MIASLVRLHHTTLHPAQRLLFHTGKDKRWSTRLRKLRSASSRMLPTHQSCQHGYAWSEMAEDPRELRRVSDA